MTEDVVMTDASSPGTGKRGANRRKEIINKQAVSKKKGKSRGPGGPDSEPAKGGCCAGDSGCQIF